jgi:integrase
MLPVDNVRESILEHEQYRAIRDSPPVYARVCAGDRLSHMRSQGRDLRHTHEGQSVFVFENAWAAACKAAGISGTLFHDLCRTVVTNLIEAGLGQREAMEISGHKTRAVLDRYHIVSERRDAAKY